MTEKYKDEEGKRTKELAEIENLFGITHEELAEIVSDEIRLNEENEKSAFDKALGKTIEKFTKESNSLSTKDRIETIKENDQIKYKNGDR